MGRGNIKINRHRCNFGTASEYEAWEKESSIDYHIPVHEPVIFFDVDVCDASDFANSMKVKDVEVNGYVGLFSSY